MTRALCFSLLALALGSLSACQKQDEPKASPPSGQSSTGPAPASQAPKPAESKPATTGGSVGSAYKKGLDKLEGGMQKKADQTKEAQR